MIQEKILQCSNCNLCSFQKPLLDNNKHADIVWVGLSAKKVDDIYDEIPLAVNTNTGKIINEIESSNYSFYKTNLVKCLPLDELGKLRYPNTEEMNACVDNLVLELYTLKPKVVFLLGAKVSNFVLNKLKSKKYRKSLNSKIIEQLDEIKFLDIYHPSYIAVYKRKYKDDYVNEVKDLINNEFIHRKSSLNSLT